jgi:GT2 family glycosyltransferase
MTIDRTRATVSVCIVTYNSARDIEDCLDAVVGQSFPVSSVIVVDNASTDGTSVFVSEIGEPVRLLANVANNGFAGGQNQAIAQTDSDYVLVLNPDVVLDPDYIANLVDYMDNHPCVGSATGQLVLADRPELMDSAGIALSSDHNAYDLAAGEPVSRWLEPREVFGVSGAAAMYRTAMIRDIAFEGQFFDETYFAYKEDVDVAWRAKHRGWLSWYVPAARAVHARGWKKRSRGSIPLFVRRHSYQNRFFTLIKNEPFGWHLIKLLPILLVKESAKLAYLLMRERGLLACWPYIMRQLPDMLRKRRHILDNRTQR